MQSAASMPRPVLVIDDNLVNQRMVLRYLTAKGFPAVGAANTSEAEVALKAHHPGLALVDVSLPGEDGLSWVRRLRSTGPLKTVMIAFTAHVLPGDRERALEAGCQDVMTKPIDWKSLIAAAEKFCSDP